MQSFAHALPPYNAARTWWCTMCCNARLHDRVHRVTCVGVDAVAVLLSRCLRTILRRSMTHRYYPFLRQQRRQRRDECSRLFARVCVFSFCTRSEVQGSETLSSNIDVAMCGIFTYAYILQFQIAAIIFDSYRYAIVQCQSLIVSLWCYLRAELLNNSVLHCLVKKPNTILL